MVDYTEKRDFQRMTLDCSLEYQKFDDKKTYQGSVKNLSATGILFTVDQPLSLGIKIQIKLTPTSDITPPLSAEVKVTRCDKHADGVFYVAGEMTQVE